MKVKIDHDLLDRQHSLYKAVHKQLQEDHLVSNGNFMLKEDAVTAAVIALVLRAYILVEDDV